MTRWARCRCDRSMRLQGMAVRLFAGKAACALDPADDWSQILLMLIETEMTPNPATLKFLPGRQVMESGTRDFATPEEAEVSRSEERRVGKECGRTGRIRWSTNH